MLNKIKIIGKAYPIEFKAQEEYKEPMAYFSLSVPSPSGATTNLRCGARGEMAEKVKNEIQEGDIVEVRGYLRNEKLGRQILVRVLNFTKLDINFEEIDNNSANHVRLLGKIVTEFNLRPSHNANSEIISFKITVPREGIKLPLFFCRARGELVPEITDKLKKGDIILLEGFLQTIRIMEGEKPSYISAIICQGFTFLDNDSGEVFAPLDKLTRIIKEVEKID